MTQALIVLLIFGACVVYVDICVDQVHPMMGDVPRWTLTLIVTAAVFSLSLLNSIRALSIPAAIGSLLMLYAAVMVVRNCASGGCSSEVETNAWSTSPFKLISAVPTVCFGYQGYCSSGC